MNKPLKSEVRKSIGQKAVDTIKDIEERTKRLCKNVWFHTTEMGKLLVVGRFVKDETDSVTEIVHDYTEVK